MFLLTVLVMSTFVVGLVANQPLSEDWFGGDGKGAAAASAPMFFFGKPRGNKPCYPEAAEHNGQQTNGVNQDNGVHANLNKGCADPGNNRKGNPFPVYYSTNKCDNNHYRIVYSIYFKKDSGHKSDWEWVAVEWERQGQSNNFVRKSIFLSQHSSNQRIDWNKIQNTADDINDWESLGQKDKNHAKVYVGAFYHAIWQDRKTSFDSVINTNSEFRSRDYYFTPEYNDLRPANVVPKNWDWGKATSSPQVMRDSICGK
ncbi:hypothetical protein M3Y95_00647400 [Aphelenchoides besseyi]|nr:hypothetical protein M3Y95_00647400 [Aphelenchoides besseyi]